VIGDFVHVAKIGGKRCLCSELGMRMSWRLVRGREMPQGRVAVMRSPLLFCLNPQRHNGSTSGKRPETGGQKDFAEPQAADGRRRLIAEGNEHRD